MMKYVFIFLILACAGAATLFINKHAETTMFNKVTMDLETMELKLSQFGYHDKYYKFLAEEWDNNIKNGIYGSRISDESLVVRYHSTPSSDFFNYSYPPSFNFIKITYIDTEFKCVRTVFIEKDLIKPIHSNWGLTQDVWALDKRITDIEKGKECGINDNPNKPKRK